MTAAKQSGEEALEAIVDIVVGFPEPVAGLAINLADRALERRQRVVEIRKL